jgi:hypothetical protein
MKILRGLLIYFLGIVPIAAIIIFVIKILCNLFLSRLGGPHISFLQAGLMVAITCILRVNFIKEYNQLMFKKKVPLNKDPDVAGYFLNKLFDKYKN